MMENFSYYFSCFLKYWLSRNQRNVVLSDSLRDPSLIFQSLLFQDSKLAAKANVLFDLNPVCIDITYSDFESLLTKERDYCTDSEIR